MIVTAKNKGNQHIQLTELKLSENVKNSPVIDERIFQYLLPHQSHTWTIALNQQPQLKNHFKPKAIQVAKLDVESDLGPIEALVPIA